MFLAAAAEPPAGLPVRRQYGPSAPADAVAEGTLPAALPPPAQLAIPSRPLSVLLPSPIVLQQPMPMPSRALELARLHQAWRQQHFKRMPLSQYLTGRWACPVWVPQRDVPGRGRDAALPAAPVQTGAAAAAVPAFGRVQQPARQTSADAAPFAASEEEPDADGVSAAMSAQVDRKERQRIGRQAQLLAKLKKAAQTKAQRLKRREKLARKAAKRAAKKQRQSAQQRADEGTAASSDDDAIDTDIASQLPHCHLPGQPLVPSRGTLAQQPAAGSAAAEPAQCEQPASLPTYDPWQDADSLHPEATLLLRTSASMEPAEQDAPAAAVAAPAAAVTDAAEQESAPQSGELAASRDTGDEAPHAYSESAPRLTPKPGQDAPPRTGKQAPLLLKPKERKLNKNQQFKRRLEKLARCKAERTAAQQKRQSVQQRADESTAASADDDATDTNDASKTARALLPGQLLEPTLSLLLLGQQTAAGSAAAEPAQPEQPARLPAYDPWQDADRPHPAPRLLRTSVSVEPAAAAQDAPAYDPWEEAESSQGLQLPTTVKQWSPAVHRIGEHADLLAQGVALQATPPQMACAPAATGRWRDTGDAPDASPAGMRSQQQHEQPSAAAANYDPWNEGMDNAAQLVLSANEQPLRPVAKQPGADVPSYDPWVEVDL